MKFPRNMFAWCSLFMSYPLAAQSVSVTVQPGQPSMERSRCCILLSLDFEVSAPDTLTLEAIHAVLLDSRGKEIGTQRAARSGGPGVVALPASTVIPGKMTSVANPFPSIDAKTPITSVQYTLEFSGRNGIVSTVSTVSPVTYVTRTDLMFPVEGRILTAAGRNATAPRSMMDQAIAQDLAGFRRQFNRYAYDLMVVDSSGALNRNGGTALEDWFGYRAVVVAPAAGVVRVAENNRRDNRLGSVHQPCCSSSDPTWFAGNYIVIDHENGECSLLAHLRQGSQSVAEGDRVTRGQRIGEVGLSGDSFTVPHLHYQLMDSCNFTDAEGLPSRFSAFERLSGPNDGQEIKAYVGAGEVVLVRPYFKR
jgi:hypothetical protein